MIISGALLSKGRRHRRKKYITQEGKNE